MRISGLFVALVLSTIFSVVMIAAQHAYGFSDALYYAVTMPVSLLLGMSGDDIYRAVFERERE